MIDAILVAHCVVRHVRGDLRGRRLLDGFQQAPAAGRFPADEIVGMKRVMNFVRLEELKEAGAETQWHEVIDRRSREIEEGKVNCRSVEQVIQDIRDKLRLVP